MDFTQNRYSTPRTIEKMKILAAVLELTTKEHCQSSPFTSTLGQISQMQCQLNGSSKTTPRILIFSIAMGADYLFCAKSTATCAPTCFEYSISVLASVDTHMRVEPTENYDFGYEVLTSTLYDVILRIARNLLDTWKNTKLQSQPFYHIICDLFSWG